MWRSFGSFLVNPASRWSAISIKSERLSKQAGPGYSGLKVNSVRTTFLSNLRCNPCSVIIINTFHIPTDRIDPELPPTNRFILWDMRTSPRREHESQINTVLSGEQRLSRENTDGGNKFINTHQQTHVSVIMWHAVIKLLSQQQTLTHQVGVVERSAVQHRQRALVSFLFLFTQLRPSECISQAQFWREIL